MSKVDELFAYLNERGLRIGGMTLGPEATPESVAEQMLESLKAIERGECEEVELDDELPQP